MERAKRHMDDASGELDRADPEEAGRDQDLALEELEQAQRELEEALNQLRREERQETLRDLESRFREMLSRQRAINEATLALHGLGEEHFTRAERLRLAELSVEERSLSERASTCLHILDEEGTTVVFPRVVGHVAADMATVADRLAAYQVGELTQLLEREIVETLEQLVGAVQRMQQENEQSAGGMQMGGDGNDPLLPASAELKLLRSSQQRVNDWTIVIEGARAAGTETEEGLDEALAGAAARQAECAAAARDMRDRQDRP
jgi:hypothetical protein